MIGVVGGMDAIGCGPTPIAWSRISGTCWICTSCSPLNQEININNVYIYMNVHIYIYIFIFIDRENVYMYRCAVNGLEKIINFDGRVAM